MKIQLKNVRLAFPSIFRAQAFNEGDPAFSATFLIDKESPLIDTIDEAIEAVAKDKWKDKAPAMLKQLRSSDKICVHDGDLKSNYAGFEGCDYLQARNKTRPLVIDADKTPLNEQDGKPYGGCYVNAMIELWAQDNKFGKRINATLTGVQFAKHGDAFSGGTSASVDDFDEVDVEELDLV